MKLQKHQFITIQKFSKSNQKGLFVNHYMGSGKTILGIFFALQFEQKKIIISPYTLLHMWEKEIERFVPHERQKEFLLYSYEDLDKQKVIYEKQILIMDEFHEFVQTLSKNKNKKYIKISKKMQKAKKIMCLTGTPMYGKIEDLFIIINFVSGKNSIPLNKEQFYEKFMQKRSVKIFFNQVFDFVFKFVPSLIQFRNLIIPSLIDIVLQIGRMILVRKFDKCDQLVQKKEIQIDCDDKKASVLKAIISEMAVINLAEQYCDKVKTELDQVNRLVQGGVNAIEQQPRVPAMFGDFRPWPTLSGATPGLAAVYAETQRDKQLQLHTSMLCGAIDLYYKISHIHHFIKNLDHFHPFKTTVIDRFIKHQYENTGTTTKKDGQITYPHPPNTLQKQQLFDQCKTFLETLQAQFVPCMQQFQNKNFMRMYRQLDIDDDEKIKQFILELAVSSEKTKKLFKARVKTLKTKFFTETLHSIMEQVLRDLCLLQLKKNQGQMMDRENFERIFERKYASNQHDKIIQDLAQHFSDQGKAYVYESDFMNELCAVILIMESNELASKNTQIKVKLQALGIKNNYEKDYQTVLQFVVRNTVKKMTEACIGKIKYDISKDGISNLQYSESKQKMTINYMTEKHTQYILFIKTIFMNKFFFLIYMLFVRNKELDLSMTYKLQYELALLSKEGISKEANFYVFMQSILQYLSKDQIQQINSYWRRKFVYVVNQVQKNPKIPTNLKNFFENGVIERMFLSENDKIDLIDLQYQLNSLYKTKITGNDPYKQQDFVNMIRDILKNAQYNNIDSDFIKQLQYYLGDQKQKQYSEFDKNQDMHKNQDSMKAVEKIQKYIEALSVDRGAENKYIKALKKFSENKGLMLLITNNIYIQSIIEQTQIEDLVGIVDSDQKLKFMVDFLGKLKIQSDWDSAYIRQSQKQIYELKNANIEMTREIFDVSILKAIPTQHTFNNLSAVFFLLSGQEKIIQMSESEIEYPSLNIWSFKYVYRVVRKLNKIEKIDLQIDPLVSYQIWTQQMAGFFTGDFLSHLMYIINAVTQAPIKGIVAQQQQKTHLSTYNFQKFSHIFDVLWFEKHPISIFLFLMICKLIFLKIGNAINPEQLSGFLHPMQVNDKNYSLNEQKIGKIFQKYVSTYNIFKSKHAKAYREQNYPSFSEQIVFHDYTREQCQLWYDAISQTLTYKQYTKISERKITEKQYEILQLQLQQHLFNDLFNLQSISNYGKYQFPEKFEYIFQQSKKQKTIIYSSFVKNGSILFSKFLQKKNKPHILMDQNDSVEQMKNKVQQFNENPKITILILDPQMIAGLSFKNVRQFHILNPIVQQSVKEQLIMRAIRFQSHNQLPLEQRNVKFFIHITRSKFFQNVDVQDYDRKFQVFNYISTQKKSFFKKIIDFFSKYIIQTPTKLEQEKYPIYRTKNLHEISPDQHIYNIIIGQKMAMESLQKTLQEYCIEQENTEYYDKKYDEYLKDDITRIRQYNSSMDKNQKKYVNRTKKEHLKINRNYFLNNKHFSNFFI